MLKVHHGAINANKKSLLSSRVNLLHILTSEQTKKPCPNDKSTFLN